MALSLEASVSTSELWRPAYVMPGPHGAVETLFLGGSVLDRAEHRQSRLVGARVCLELQVHSILIL